MKGLSCRFPLKNGAFCLTEGADKAKDNIWFYCIFDKFRVYCSDFGGNFVSLVQKPMSYLVLNRTLIFRKLQVGIEKYAGNVKVDGIDIIYRASNPRDYHLQINYSTQNEDDTVSQNVIFV
jgi:hypothetical protein